MRIWCKCIEWLRPKKKVIRSPFVCLEDVEYSSTEESLGASGTVKIHPQNLVIQMSYTARYGFWVQIKRVHPWKIMFEYMDSTYLVNDENDRGYDNLVESLNRLKQDIKKRANLDVYNALEAIMYDYVVKYYQEQQ